MQSNFWGETNDNAPRFCLILSKIYSKPCGTPNIKYFPKIIKEWYSPLFLEKRGTLDVSRSSEYISDYPEAYSVIIKWGFDFESFSNFSNLISILPKYLEQKFSRYVQQSYVWNLLKIHHEEQGKLLLSCFGFLIGTCSQLSRLFLLVAMMK